MNAITMLIKMPRIMHRKWLTCSAMPVFIFSISLQIIKPSIYSLLDMKKKNFCWTITYSARRTVKFDFPFSISYHPMSCRISDEKYSIRIRAIWEIAARLKQSTLIIPAISWIIVSTTEAIRNAIESFSSSSRFSTMVTFVLLMNKHFQQRNFSIYFAQRYLA